MRVAAFVLVLGVYLALPLVSSGAQDKVHAPGSWQRNVQRPGVDLRVEAGRFRALAYIENRHCRLVSRNGHAFRRFDPLCAALAQELKVNDLILDGEIVCLDEEGRSLFNPLLFRKRTPIFPAFDLLWVDGEDLRELPLIERKKRLRRVIPQHDPHQNPHLLHVDFIWEKGTELFALACERDLEGVVGKWAKGRYQSDGRSTSWVKIKNPSYSQAEGRAELFERKPHGTRPKAPEHAASSALSPCVGGQE